MASFYRGSIKNNTQGFNDKITNELKTSAKFQRLSKFDNNHQNNEELKKPIIIQSDNNCHDIEIHENREQTQVNKMSRNSYDHLFHPIHESVDYETFIMPIKQANIINNTNDTRVSPLSKTPDSIDESWINNATPNTQTPYYSHKKSNSNSSISPSNESVKRGSGSSGVINTINGIQSDNEQLDEYSTEGDELEVVADLNEDDDEQDDYENDEEIEQQNKHQQQQQHAQLQKQQEDLIKNNKSTTIINKQAPIPPPKLNETQKHLNAFINQTIINEKPYIDKLAYLVNFRLHLEKYCLDSTNADLNVLFTHVEQIFERHKLFYTELKQLSNEIFKNDLLTLLLNALNIFNVMLMTSLKLYSEFLDNYPKAMIILNKFENEKFNFTNKMGNLKIGSSSPEAHYNRNEHRKSFIECEIEYFQNTFDNNEQYDTAQIFAKDLLKRPIELVKYLLSLKEECSYFIQITKNQSRINEFYGENELNFRIKELFDNDEYIRLKEEILKKIDRALLPNRVRKNEDVVESCENNEKKLRHLILYGDCLICCRIKKDKKQLKWFIPMDRLEVHLGETKQSMKADSELKTLRDEAATLSGNLRRQENDQNLNSTFKRSTVKMKKKFDEHQTELQFKLSTFKLIVRHNHAINLVGTATASLVNMHGSVANLSSTNIMNSSTSSMTSSMLASKNETFHLLFTSDFERISWLEEINGAIYAYKSRKPANPVPLSEVETRINNLQKIEEPAKKNSLVTCTGTLELTVKHMEGLTQPSKSFVAVELKSFGSYLQVAQTKCTDYTTKPLWEEKFSLELQCVESVRIILYCETSTKPLAIGSHELKVNPKDFESAKAVSIKLNNNLNLIATMKFLSPKKQLLAGVQKNKTDIFGKHIHEVLEKEKATIPRILKDCVEVIEANGINEIGIYRVSAVVSEVQKLKDLYSKNPDYAQRELKLKSPHLAASLLKLFLRELPDPLFTSDLYPSFINAIDMYNVPIRDQLLCQTFNQLPEANKTILIFILNHLHNISSNSQKNKMDSRNLTTLFGPTLMKLSPKDKLEADNMAKEISESTQQASVLFYIMKLHSQGKLVQYGKEIDNNNANNNNNNTLTNTKPQTQSTKSAIYPHYENNRIYQNFLSNEQINKDLNNNLVNKQTSAIIKPMSGFFYQTPQQYHQQQQQQQPQNQQQYAQHSSKIYKINKLLYKDVSI